jgi:hypothetical protein
MDTARIRRELSGSVRLLWARERWLWSGVVAVLAGFALWVGATGAALNYGAEFAGQPLSVTAWSSTTTVVFATVTVLWIVVPAALVTYLVNSYVTNVSGNVHTHYRVEHPVTLVVPVLVLFAVGAAGGVALGEVPTALAGALVAAGLLLLVRTLAYSYRVFSFSSPFVVWVGLFVSLAVTAVALLVGTATVAGRRAFVEDAAAGVSALLGSGTVADILTGTTTAGPVTVSTLLGLAAVLPAGFALSYILVQILVGLGNRFREPDVPRSQLRTGQRYPGFAHPIAEGSGRTPTAPDTAASATNGGPSQSSNDPSRTGSSGPAATADSDLSGDDADDADQLTADTGETDDGVDDVSHTKVFTAPDDGFDGDVPGVDDAPAQSDDETAVVGSADSTDRNDDRGGDGYRCPTCADSFESDTNFAYCPTCGTELQPE